ncbi:hypothetical protein SAMN05444342_3732 [Haladaptatus paucihalophilus DX253]|uniref:Uncharacterized protein n=2 Tax=Haladaptatus paucihalophilus DX253 TaxID=797209 RepID=A0A1M7A708_HALPU|nr:hypothetical protein SAMN05444342_3732 [Haladaptatus paucihalophilus DX253]
MLLCDTRNAIPSSQLSSARENYNCFPCVTMLTRGKRCYAWDNTIFENIGLECISPFTQNFTDLPGIIRMDMDG